MASFSVNTAKDKKRVERMVRDLPLVLSGKKNDIYGIRKAYWGGFAHSLYSDIIRAFTHKSRLLSGITSDDLGNAWQDLSPQTKAYRKSKYRVRKSRDKLGLLSSSQKKEWWKIYNRYKAYFMRSKNFSEAQSKTAAAKKAWVELKKQGAKTKIEVFGKERFPILIDTGRLFNSLTPGSFNGTQYRARNRYQIFIITRKGLTLGTRVKYASDHHEPKRTGFPQRRLWPEKMQPWLKSAMNAGVLAAVRCLASKL